MVYGFLALSLRVIRSNQVPVLTFEGRFPYYRILSQHINHSYDVSVEVVSSLLLHILEC